MRTVIAEYDNNLPRISGFVHFGADKVTPPPPIQVWKFRIILFVFAMFKLVPLYYINGKYIYFLYICMMMRTDIVLSL